MLVVNKNPKAKRMRLRIDRRRKVPVLVLNKRMKESDGIAFALKNAGWIQTQLAKLPEEKVFCNGMIFSLFGENVVIHHSPESKRGVWLENGVLFVSGHEEHLKRRVLDFIKTTLKTKAKQKADDFAQILGIKAGKITIRDTKSRWGSCNKKGDLSLSWRLALAPREILEYVIAHEVSHIREMNHSDKFWKTVEILQPSYKLHEKWLRKNADFLCGFSV